MNRHRLGEKKNHSINCHRIFLQTILNILWISMKKRKHTLVARMEYQLEWLRGPFGRISKWHFWLSLHWRRRSGLFRPKPVSLLFSSLSPSPFAASWLMWTKISHTRPFPHGVSFPRARQLWNESPETVRQIKPFL